MTRSGNAITTSVRRFVSIFGFVAVTVRPVCSAASTANESHVDNSTFRRTESVRSRTSHEFTGGTLTMLSLHFHFDSTVVVC